MSSNSSSCLFHPPGGSPFGKRENYHSNYHPSLGSDVLKKNLKLTPERITRRSEYALPPEQYTPEQYSFIKDDNFEFNESIKTTTPTKLPRPVPKINWTASGIESVPPTNDPSSTTTPHFVSVPRQAVVPVKIKTTFAENSDMPTSPLSERLHQFRFGVPKPRSARMKMKETLGGRSVSNNQSTASKTTTLSNQSNSRKRTPHNQSKTSTSKQASKSNTRTKSLDESNRKQSDSMSLSSSIANKVNSHSTLSGDVGEKTNTFISHPSDHDETYESLNSRLSQLLQETQSVLSSSPDDFLSFPEYKVPSSSKDASTGIACEPPSHQTAERYQRFSSTSSLPHNAPVHRFCTDKRSLEPKQVNTERQEQSKTTPTYNVSRLQEAARHKDSQHPTDLPSPQQEDDILFQWRLRRKMASAKKAVDENSRKDFYPYKHDPASTVHTQPCKATAERPYDVTQPQTTTAHYSHSYCCGRGQVKDASVNVIPLTSSQTQTTKSLNEEWNESELSLQQPTQPDVMLATRSSDESTVSFHKATVVKADNSRQQSTHATSPKSTKTFKTDTSIWSSNNTTLPPTELQSTEDLRSPAGNAVKNVIGMRLFETPSSVDTQNSTVRSTPLSKPHGVESEEFNDSYNTITDLPKKKETSNKQNVESSLSKGNKEVESESTSHVNTIDQILEEIEIGVDDFHDDPVMQSLRGQRSQYLQELGSIEEILNGCKLGSA